MNIVSYEFMAPDQVSSRLSEIEREAKRQRNHNTRQSVESTKTHLTTFFTRMLHKISLSGLWQTHFLQRTANSVE